MGATIRLSGGTGCAQTPIKINKKVKRFSTCFPSRFLWPAVMWLQRTRCVQTTCARQCWIINWNLRLAAAVVVDNNNIRYIAPRSRSEPFSPTVWNLRYLCTWRDENTTVASAGGTAFDGCSGKHVARKLLLQRGMTRKTGKYDSSAAGSKVH